MMVYDLLLMKVYSRIVIYKTFVQIQLSMPVVTSSDNQQIISVNQSNRDAEIIQLNCNLTPYELQKNVLWHNHSVKQTM